MISFIFAIASFMNGIANNDIRLVYAAIGFCFTGVLSEYVLIKYRKERKE